MQEWQQSPIEAQYVIRNLAIENQTVLHSMMETGTTGIAALNLNRRFIRIEIDKKHFEIGKNRIVYDIILISIIEIFGIFKFYINVIANRACLKFLK